MAAIIAAAMSTVDSALNCSATVYLLDFHKRYINPDVDEANSVFILRSVTVLWGILGTGFAILCIYGGGSTLDLWWAVSGIFGGAILGLFLLALFRTRLQVWQGLVSILISFVVIGWGTFARDLPESMQWLQCNLDSIIVGTAGTIALLIAASLFSLANRKNV